MFTAVSIVYNLSCCALQPAHLLCTIPLTMKLSAKTRPHLLRLLFLGLMLGTLSWGIIEKVAALSGLPFDVSLGPIGFDIYVISAYIRINPGSVLGAFLGYRLFASA